MEPKRTNIRYSKEFKEEAVKLVLERGYSVPQAAKYLFHNQSFD
jgi:transposase-like protein